MKARFNNLIGQVYHAQGEYEQAKKYYEKANNRGLKFNSITLAQTLIHGNMLK
jgi:tetratricopeptide (TPR) repeat protein